MILLSARAGEEAAVEGLDAGADDYLVKPFAASELLARVRAVLALARVRRREAAWRGALLGALQDGLFVVDGAGQVVQINEGFADIFGYGRDGLPYAVPHPWWPDADREPDEYQQVVAAMAEVQASGQARKLLALRHRDGHRLWIECSADTIADPDRPDGPPMLIGLARDVTAVHRVGRRDRLLAQTAEILASTEPTAVEGAAAETESAGGRLVGRFQRVVDLAAPVFDDLVVVVRTGPDGRMPPVAAAHPRRPEQAQEMLALDPYHLPTSLVQTYRQGRAFVLDPAPALLREALRSDADSLARAGLGRHATLVAPLAVHGRLLGLLIVLCPGDHPGSHSEASSRSTSSTSSWPTSWPVVSRRLCRRNGSPPASTSSTPPPRHSPQRARCPPPLPRWSGGPARLRPQWGRDLRPALRQPRTVAADPQRGPSPRRLRAPRHRRRAGPHRDRGGGPHRPLRVGERPHPALRRGHRRGSLGRTAAAQAGRSSACSA